MLLLKMALLIPLLAAAATNRGWVLPHLGAQISPERFRMAAQWLSKLMRTEAVLGVILLGVVAVLTQLPPATVAGSTSPSVQNKGSGEFVISLQVTPQQAGYHRMVAWVRSKDGVVVSDARRVTFFLNMLEMDMGLQTVQAQPSGDGSYVADAVLPMAGRWRVSVEVSPPQHDTFLTEFDLFVATLERSGRNP